MAEIIRESIFIGSDIMSVKLQPKYMIWRGRTYQFSDMGLHHTTHDGDVLIHLFSMTTTSACFRISFNTKTLLWVLEGVEAA